MLQAATLTTALLSVLTATACKYPDGSRAQGRVLSTDTPEVGADERLITILATNDVHGSLEPDQRNAGGVAYFSGVAAAIRTGLAARLADHAGVLTVDAGDQFQGTLLSNFSEGRAMFQAMNAVQYDAVISGNHDFDFGPEGWLVDISPMTAGTDPAGAAAAKRGALLAAAKVAAFSLVSANIYARASLVTAAGEPVPVASAGCQPADGAQTVDWTKAARADFVKPYVLRQIAGVCVAVIGVDNELTAETSMAPNVSDLSFRDARAAFLEIRGTLAAEADVFVMLVHDGNMPGKSDFKQKLADLLAAHPGAVDAVVTGHSHVVERYDIAGVPVIQSGSGGTMFGRIDLVYDATAHRVKIEKTRALAGLALAHDACAPEAEAFCAKDPAGGVAYEGIRVEPSAEAEKVIGEARTGIKAIAGRILGTAPSEIKRSRKELSPLGIAIADLLRAATKTDVVFINSATLRDTLPKGVVTYERLFRVLPFSNRTLVLKPVTREHLAQLALDSATKSGEYGILVPSGLEITYDKAAGTLVRVALADGRLIFSKTPGATLAAGPFRVATFDFLANKTSGVAGLNDVAIDQDLGVFRELVADHLEGRGFVFPTTVDQRVIAL